MKRNVTIFLLFCVSMLTHVHLMAQQLQIQGHVTDRANGSAITHATIQVVGTSTTTAPNDKGFFTIRVPNAKSQVKVTAIGYAAKTVAITNPADFLEIQLDTELGNIDEVVVVGYGTQTRGTLTSAISSVKAKDLENMPLTRVEQALQGRTSGVLVMTNSGQPGSAANVRVRGTTSLNDNNPLWVVDGVIVDNGGIGYINQSDIESIDVLKDAASQAIYGARAASGVILVTTKKGKLGAPSISYNGFYGSSGPAKKLKLADASQYAMLRNESLTNDGKPALFANPESYGRGTDWQEEIFNNAAIRHSHEFSVSGGTEKSTYYSSFGYLNQEGIVATEISKYKRLNFRFNSTYSPASWITFGQNIGYAREKSTGLGNTNSEFGGPLSSAINLDPITPVVVTDAAVAGQAPYTTPYVVRDGNGNPYGISPYVAQEMTNPVAFIQTRLGNYNWSDNIVGNAFAEIMPIEGLKFRSSIGTKLAFFGNEAFTPQFYLSATGKNDKANFSRGMNRSMSWIFDNTINYSKSFNDHNFNILLGHSALMNNNSYGINGTYFGIPVDNFNEASMNFPVPNTDKNLNGSEGVLQRIQSFFGRVNYNYKGRYLLEALVRRDGSTRFGPDRKYGNFPSVSAGWVVSSEDFWNTESATFNFLKIRGGYGVVGNDNIRDFGYAAIIGGGRNYSFGTEGAYLTGNSPNSIPNSQLGWEETRSSSLGLEAVLFKNLSLSIDLFDKRTKGILQEKPVPGYVGVVSNPVANIANLSNKGLEVSLGYNKQQGDWTYGASGNVSYVQNRVTYLGEGLQFLEGGQNFQSSSFPIARTYVGHPVFSFYGMKHLGIFQNQQEIDAYVGPNGNKIQPNAKPGDFKWTDVDGDGVIGVDDRTLLGTPIPTWTYGLSLNAAYKNFDISVFGQGVGGNKIFQGLRRLDINSANYQAKALDRWHGEGTSNTHPRLTDDDANRNYRNPSQFYLEKGDYFRLKVIQLGYTFKNFSSQIGARNLRIYAMAENLFTITKYTGYDPEIGGGANNAGMGIDRGIYPQARSFMFGLNVGF